jgi:hypothetical protein
MNQGDRWLEEQPDLITCPAMGTKMTLRACKKRLKSPFHYLQKVSRLHDSEDDLEVNVSFRGCESSKCPHYKPTKKRARCYRGSGGRNKKLSERLNEKSFNAFPRKA